ncbi:MAG: 4Fe-4S binding protein [Chromatiales bacterium]|nr:4Fe-4S binding protein [Chromatiales bacterium]
MPVRALPERDVRQGHADHHLRRRARRAARRALAQGRRRATPGLGDCIDCGLCVQVCPTGIDIRNGPAVRVHRLRRLHRRLQRRDGQDELPARPDPLHHRKRA